MIWNKASLWFFFLLIFSLKTLQWEQATKVTIVYPNIFGILVFIYEIGSAIIWRINSQNYDIYSWIIFSISMYYTC